MRVIRFVAPLVACTFVGAAFAANPPAAPVTPVSAAAAAPVVVPPGMTLQQGSFLLKLAIRTMNGHVLRKPRLLLFPVQILTQGNSRFAFTGINAPSIGGSVGSKGDVTATRPNDTFSLAGRATTTWNMGGSFGATISGRTLGGNFAVVAFRKDDPLFRGQTQVRQTLGTSSAPERANLTGTIVGTSVSALDPTGDVPLDSDPMNDPDMDVPGDDATSAIGDPASDQKAKADWLKKTDGGVPTDQQGKAGTNGDKMKPKTDDKKCGWLDLTCTDKTNTKKDNGTGDMPDNGGGGIAIWGSRPTAGGGPTPTDQGGTAGGGGVSAANGSSIKAGPNLGDNPFETSPADVLNASKLLNGARDPMPTAQVH